MKSQVLTFALIFGILIQNGTYGLTKNILNK